MKLSLVLTVATASSLLSACFTKPIAVDQQAHVPAQWQTQLSETAPQQDLTKFWQNQNDPLLLELLDSAHKLSPDLASARSRLEAARATWVASSAVFLPQVTGEVSAARARNQVATPIQNTRQAGLQVSWELDLFGANRAVANYAKVQLESAEAQWHGVKIAISAEVAQRYYELRACQRASAVSEREAASWQSSLTIYEQSYKSGMLAATSFSQLSATAADSARRAQQQTAACGMQTQALMALTGVPLTRLQQQFTEHSLYRELQAVAVSQVPAQSLAQRPDVFAAEREVQASLAQLNAYEAQRLPRVSLTGYVAQNRSQTQAEVNSGTVFSIGPLHVTMPVFDGGQRKANVEAQRARYDEARLAYQGRLRTAVAEVEQALLQLNSSDFNLKQLQINQQASLLNLQSTQARLRQGMASQLELEEAKRNAGLHELESIQAGLERNRAWLSLYRAVGGGWQPTSQN